MSFFVCCHPRPADGGSKPTHQCRTPLSPSAAATAPLDWKKFDRISFRSVSLSSCRSLQTHVDEFLPRCAKPPGAKPCETLVAVSVKLCFILELVSCRLGLVHGSERAWRLAAFFPKGTQIPATKRRPRISSRGLFFQFSRTSIPLSVKS